MSGNFEAIEHGTPPVASEKNNGTVNLLDSKNRNSLDRDKTPVDHLNNLFAAALLSQKNQDGGGSPIRAAAASGAASPEHMPDLKLVGATDEVASLAPHPGPVAVIDGPGPIEETMNVVNTLIDGQYDQVLHHPLRLVGTAAGSAAIGLAVSVGAGIAIGTGLLSAPAITAAGAAIAAGYLGWTASRAYDNRESIIKNAEIVADPAAHSAKDVALATRYVRGLGGDLLNLEVAYGVGGTFGAGINSGMAKGAENVLANSTRTLSSPAVAWVERVSYPIPYIRLTTGAAGALPFSRLDFSQKTPPGQTPNS